MKQMTKLGLLASSAIAAASLVACGGGGGGASTPAPVATQGSLSVALTDAPACGFTAVNVTVNKVRVNKSATASDTDAGWTDITLSPAKKINLLDFNNGGLAALGEAPLDAGHYTQIRLVLDSNASGNANTVVPTGGAETPIDTPSALQSGIKLNGEFDVAAGQKSDIVLDFDACKSIVSKGHNGGYLLKPVIKMVPYELNGIDGFVATALLNSNVQVSAQQNGKVVSATAPDPKTGEFFLSRLPVGNYDVVITADNSAASVIGAVPVTSTKTTTVVSTSLAPITLATSTMGSIGGTVTLTPPSTTVAASVVAKQSFTGGPTVQVKYQGADLATGAYTIANLPIAAPQYVVYSSTLPLVFAASTTTTPGKYSVEASADGYAAKSVDGVDITTTNQTAVNFSLAP